MSSESHLSCDGEPSTLSISVEHDRAVNYAMQQNDVPIIKSLRITNNGEENQNDLLLTIVTEPSFASVWETRIGSIGAGESYNLGTVDISLSHDFLASLTERISGSLHLDVRRQNASIIQISHPIDVLAYDEWNGLQSLPEILAAFITPNHPAIESVLSEAAELLGKWSGNSSISGYQSKDPRRVTLITAAIYAALQQRSIRYINPPASFEEIGQKIRLPGRILESRLGTCLDLTILFAACIESPLVSRTLLSYKKMTSGGSDERQTLHRRI